MTWEALKTTAFRGYFNVQGVGKRQLVIRIGSVPLCLCGREGTLLHRATQRYNFFQSQQRGGFPVVLDGSPQRPGSRFHFHYDLNGSSVQVARRAARVSGVTSEYQLDSMLRVLLTVLLLPRNGFLLHAATVERDGKAYVFMGRSGAGKSTVASLAPAGSVLTDEISLLRCTGGVWHAYGTPFWGEFRADGQNRRAPLAGIFELVQSRNNRKEPLRGKQALAALLGNTLFFTAARAQRESLLAIALALVESVPVYRLEFRKDDTFWEVAA